MVTIESMSPANILALALGYQHTKVLVTIVELEIPTILAAGPRTSGELAERLGADAIAIERFLDACVALRLLEREGDQFRSAPLTQRYLVRGVPAYLGDLVARHDRLSRSDGWGRFAERLRAWRPGGSGERVARNGRPDDEDLQGQHRLSLLAGEALGNAVDLSGCRRLLDLGAGTGAMSIALCRRYPELSAVAVDVPEMAGHARRSVRDSGLEHRIEVVERDFMRLPLPEDCDAVLMANVLSMSDPATARTLLSRIHARLPGGGLVVLSGWMLAEDRTRPDGVSPRAAAAVQESTGLLPALLCLEDIALDAPDVEHTSADYACWLARAGFERIEHRVYYPPLSYVLGRRPADPL